MREGQILKYTEANRVGEIQPSDGGPVCRFYLPNVTNADPLPRETVPCLHGERREKCTLPEIGFVLLSKDRLPGLFCRRRPQDELLLDEAWMSIVHPKGRELRI